jgi:hypothetical protein
VTKADDLRRSVELAIAGDWDEAHEIAQRHEGDATADWLHAVLHKIEGDAVFLDVAGSFLAWWPARAGVVAGVACIGRVGGALLGMGQGLGHGRLQGVGSGPG